MNTKKIYKFILLFVFILFIGINFIYAHKGRTDSSGGHYNHSTGEYHYHHGYGPHQHPNGICPYDTTNTPNTNSFQNNTTDNTSNDISSSNKTNTIIENDNDSSSKYIINIIIGFSIIAFFIGFPIYAIIKEAINNNRKNKNNK